VGSGGVGGGGITGGGVWLYHTPSVPNQPKKNQGEKLDKTTLGFLPVVRLVCEGGVLVVGVEGGFGGVGGRVGAKLVWGCGGGVAPPPHPPRVKRRPEQTKKPKGLKYFSGSVRVCFASIVVVLG